MVYARLSTYDDRLNVYFVNDIVIGIYSFISFIEKSLKIFYNLLKEATASSIERK